VGVGVGVGETECACVCVSVSVPGRLVASATLNLVPARLLAREGGRQGAGWWADAALHPKLMHQPIPERESVCDGERESESYKAVNCGNVPPAPIGWWADAAGWLTHTHTHSLSLSLSHTHTRARSLSLTHTHSLTLSLGQVGAPGLVRLAGRLSRVVAGWPGCREARRAGATRFRVVGRHGECGEARRVGGTRFSVQGPGFRVEDLGSRV